jgi:hypothetical protein
MVEFDYQNREAQFDNYPANRAESAAHISPG